MQQRCMHFTPDRGTAGVRLYTIGDPFEQLPATRREIGELLQWAADCAAELSPIDAAAMQETMATTGARFQVAPPTSGAAAAASMRQAGLRWDDAKRALAGRVGEVVQHDALLGASKMLFCDGAQAWFPAAFLAFELPDGAGELAEGGG
eukprot:TRINITY_DN865_c0_g1_i2.p5 TRINITY_DN865_c0_g1~~TRINITY_DN865_c0_g1_i2.p5  ORF type:complete len:149 (+),score=46.80 TRINITY_DN865_c0_g1_i2:645-1091(+)